MNTTEKIIQNKQTRECNHRFRQKLNNQIHEGYYCTKCLIQVKK